MYCPIGHALLAIYLLLEKQLNQKRCADLIPRLLRAIAELKSGILPSLVHLGNTLHAWREEIATMWSPKVSTPKWKSATTSLRLS